MGLLVFYLILSLGVSFLCSLFEAVILSVSPAYASKLAKGGTRSGKLLKAQKDNLENSLSAILTLNTIAHTIGAAGVGAEVLRIWGDSAVAIGSIILTLLVLVLSEIVPKTLGAEHWRLPAPYVTHGIRGFIIISYPFVVAFRGLSKLLSAKDENQKQVTRDELLFVAELGEKEGTFSKEEAGVVKNLLLLRQLMVSDVMTPRTVVFALPQDMSIEEVYEQHPSIQFSRIPVYDENIDQVTGIVLRHDILMHRADENESSTKVILKDLMQPIHSVPETMSLSKCLQIFTLKKAHLFAVHDDHGGLEGVITLEDTIETLLGVEIMDELDSVEDMRQHALDQWEKRRKKRSR